jgi:hypothetical protein
MTIDHPTGPRRARQPNRPDPSDDAVALFAEMARAVRRRDFPEATRARVALRRLGWSVVALETAAAGEGSR